MSCDGASKEGEPKHSIDKHARYVFVQDVCTTLSGNKRRCTTLAAPNGRYAGRVHVYAGTKTRLLSLVYL